MIAAFYSVDAMNARGHSESIVTTEYAWQALYVIEALANLGLVKITLRVSPLNGGTKVITVDNGSWRVCGATTRLVP